MIAPCVISFVLPVALGISLLLAACTNSTLPGRVGLARPQLLLMPASNINNYAISQYAGEVERAQREGRLNIYPVLTERVRGIARRVWKNVCIFRSDAAHWNWEASVISSEELNAYGFAGGKIVIKSELISKLVLTDDEIAFVLGHESGHALREHTREKVSYALAASVVAQIENKDPKRTFEVSQQTFNHPAESNMEIEADLIGMELSARAGFDPTGALSFLEKLQRVGNANAHAFAGPHPDYARRKARLNEALIDFTKMPISTC